MTAAMTAIDAIRTSAALSSATHVAALRVSGSGAFATVDRLCPRELFIRDGQMLHTLLLDRDARPIADLYVCADDEDFLLLAEGLTGAQLVEHVRAHADPDTEARDLADSHALFSLDGPYAWEVFAALVGPEVIGLPYMTFFDSDDVTAFRAGKTGEFGYLMMVPAASAAGLRARLLDVGAPLDLVEGDLAALDQCALENWYFNIRREARAGLTPIELQLQWRVSSRKAYVGSEALARRRPEVTHRLLQCAASQELAAGDAIVCGDRVLGEVVNAGFSSVRGDWVATALIERRFSHPRITAYAAVREARRIAIRTLAAPAINNRSLYVNPQLHSYLTRTSVQFPPLQFPEQDQPCDSPTTP